MHVNVAGPYGVNEITLAEFQAGKLEGAQQFKDTIEGHVFTVGLGDVFRKLAKYNPADHNHTFPLVRGQASGILEAAKDLAPQLGFDVLANDALDVGADVKQQNDLKNYFAEKAKTRDYVVIAKALSPDEAWVAVKEKGDPRFSENAVKESARKFAESINVVIANSPNVVLVDRNNNVIYQKTNNELQNFDAEKFGAWKKVCSIQPEKLTYEKYGKGQQRLNAASAAGVEYADGPIPPSDKEIDKAKDQQAERFGGFGR